MGRGLKTSAIGVAVALMAIAAFAAVALAVGGDEGNGVAGATAGTSAVRTAVEYTPAPVAEKARASGTCGGPGSAGCSGAGAVGAGLCGAAPQGATSAPQDAPAAGGCCGGSGSGSTGGI